MINVVLKDPGTPPHKDSLYSANWVIAIKYEDKTKIPKKIFININVLKYVN